MEITRNQYYLAGLVLLFLGIQFRMIDTVQLTPEFSQFLAERQGHPLAAVGTAGGKATARSTYQPPEWLGWMLGSAGAVLVLHSWAMSKPSG
jgi:hypothetical protein